MLECRSGEILASQEVVHLARHVEGVSHLDRGSVRFKGLADPVRAIQLMREGWDPHSTWPSSARLAPMGDPRLPTPAYQISNPYKGLRSFEEAVDAAAFFAGKT